MIVIEQEIADYADWTVAAIQERREQIKEWALQRWQVTAPAPLVTVQPELTDPQKQAKQQSANSKVAIQATREQRDPEAWLVSLAEANGWKEGFCALINAARQAGLFVRTQNNWWVFTVTPPWNKSKAFMWVGPDFYFNYDAVLIERLYKIPEDRTMRLFGSGPRRIKPEEAPQIAEAILKLFLER